MYTVFVYVYRERKCISHYIYSYTWCKVKYIKAHNTQFNIIYLHNITDSGTHHYSFTNRPSLGHKIYFRHVFTIYINLI